VSEIKERPILFSGEMVRAILAGRKTQPRRLVTPQPLCVLPNNHEPLRYFENLPKGNYIYWNDIWRKHGKAFEHVQPYGQAGERLWVREAWQAWAEYDKLVPRDIPHNPSAILHTADRDGFLWDSRKRPPMFMPRWMSRIMLEVIDVRLERLQDITAKDCIAEGLTTNLREHDAVYHLQKQYRNIWDLLNAKRGYDWESNPWVWVIAFRRING
jgi:hypothetical protein